MFKPTHVTVEIKKLEDLAKDLNTSADELHGTLELYGKLLEPINTLIGFSMTEEVGLQVRDAIEAVMNKTEAAVDNLNRVAIGRVRDLINTEGDYN